MTHKKGSHYYITLRTRVNHQSPITNLQDFSVLMYVYVFPEKQSQMWHKLHKQNIVHSCLTASTSADITLKLNMRSALKTMPDCHTRTTQQSLNKLR